MIRSTGVAQARYHALLQLLRSADTLWNASRVFFGRWKLSPSQFNVLNLLHELPEGMSQIELSRRLIMHRSNVTGLVDRLEGRGLVERREVAADRRAYRVVLTLEGQDLLAKILPLYFQSADRVWGDISAARSAQLLSDLERVAANAEQIAAELTS